MKFHCFTFLWSLTHVYTFLLFILLWVPLCCEVKEWDFWMKCNLVLKTFIGVNSFYLNLGKVLGEFTLELSLAFSIKVLHLCVWRYNTPFLNAILVHSTGLWMLIDTTYYVNKTSPKKGALNDYTILFMLPLFVFFQKTYNANKEETPPSPKWSFVFVVVA